tara:strand:+ start:7831 stop:8052 length:222 start_codon:yes stop_codon:yes gene_type:complete
VIKEKIPRTSKVAKKSCSNYTRDDECAGFMFHFNKELGALVTFVDPVFAGEPCAVKDGCDFFEDVVVQGITER